MNRDQPYLLHIGEAIERIDCFAAGDREAFNRQPIVQDAIVRNLEVIGEASKRLSDTARAAEPRIPWREIAGMRDKLIHQYFAVDLETVWRVVELELPALRAAVIRLLDEQG